MRRSARKSAPSSGRQRPPLHRLPVDPLSVITASAPGALEAVWRLVQALADATAD
ncbi:hypothetical protein [Streptomyces sp. NPDC059757]|uniref:hypothetical protein n=1 Tax=Streptomyces sp. NPDC059757 TaxID=3346935 RepID=UPI00364BB65C